MGILLRVALCKLPFANGVATKGHNQAFYKAHHMAILALAITSDVLHLLFIEAEDGT